MRKRILVYCLVSTFYFSATAQKDSAFTLIKKIKGDITAFTADNQDNIYLINSYDQIKKLDANGDSIAVFNNVRRYGKIAQLDVSNPLRVLLYYKDFSSIVILDRLLNVRSTIDLRKHEIFQVQAISLSYDNKIWLYDEFEHKLKKLDEDGKLLFATSDFRQLFDQAFSFSSIYDQDGLLYLYDKNKGVYVFDYYGTLKNIYSITGYDNFNVFGKYILGTKKDSLLRYQPSIFVMEEIPLPKAFQNISSIHFTSSRAYVLKKEELDIFQLR